MIACVVDSSALAAWLLPDETDEAAERVAKFILGNGAAAPSLWPLEMCHVLLRAERRRRISRDERGVAMSLLSGLRVQVDPYTTQHAWGETLLLAERHGLTPYDASYLELAIRLALPLATRDKDLRAAAIACSVALLD